MRSRRDGTAATGLLALTNAVRAGRAAEGRRCGSAAWRGSWVDHEQDELGENVSVHLKPKASRAVGAEHSVPLSPEGSRGHRVQVQAASRRMECGNHGHPGLLLDYIGRGKIRESDRRFTAIPQLKRTHQ